MVNMYIYPEKDTTINSGRPDTNYGYTFLRFREYYDTRRRAFLGFGISGGPVSTAVTRVSLYMFVRKSCRHRDSPGEIRRITGSWTEDTATWNNSKDIATGDTVLERTFKHAAYDPIWDVQDITQLYKEAKDAGDSLDIEIRTEELMEEHHCRGNQFDSREVRVNYHSEPYELMKPYILIEYGVMLFQYQLIFDAAELLDQERKDLLEAEYVKYRAADQWLVTAVDPDCFSQIEPIVGGVSGDRETGWLCQAVEYGKSPCAPLPYYLCPLPTPETIYFRGECSCDHFKDILQPLGLPCQHLIAAKNWYGSTVPYCPYIQCP